VVWGPHRSGRVLMAHEEMTSLHAEGLLVVASRMLAHKQAQEEVGVAAACIPWLVPPENDAEPRVQLWPCALLPLPPT
jgi:hypothetical protein